ncbi:MAG: metallophosphoesterase [Polyangiaceae bacterium]
MRRFFLVLWIFTGLAHVVVVAAQREILTRLGAPWPGAIAVAISAALVALLGGRIELMRDDHPISGARRAAELLYYVHWCGAVAASLLFVAAGAVTLAVTAAARLASWPLPDLVRPLALGSYGAGLAVSAYAIAIRGRRARVRTVEVEVPGLAPSLDGYRIAQLSDLHIGALLGRRAAARWVAQANALAPDLVALTGDYVTNGVRFHQEIADVIGGLRAKDAVVAVLGNHDYFGGGEPLATYLGERGVVLLRNARHTITRGAASIEIAGVDDTWTRNADIERTMRGFERERPLVALSHDPALFPAFAKRGAALVLSGHTHWGQIGVPFLAERYNLARRVFRFSAGLYREGASALYVNPGLGTTGPPVRFGSPAEISLIVLRSAR